MTILASFTYRQEDAISVNGSSTGNCNTSLCIDSAGILSDMMVPSLRDLDGGEWARQLCTLHSMSSSINITSEGHAGEQIIEVIMFNCPQWSIAVQTLRLIESGTLLSIHNLDPALRSCISLVKVCIPKRVRSASPLVLQFDLHPDSSWIHIAEVIFSSGHSTCQEDTILSLPANHEGNLISSSFLQAFYREYLLFPFPNNTLCLMEPHH
jgi:hypothetical protein